MLLSAIVPHVRSCMGIVSSVIVCLQSTCYYIFDQTLSQSIYVIWDCHCLQANSVLIYVYNVV